jgi:3-oxoacyl-[acyl-carrier-protein] synthase II
MVLAARKALKDAGISADGIDLVSAFACGLVEHDAVEAKALKTILGERVGEVPTLAVKGGLGNNGAGSGAIDLIAAILAMYHGTIPPSVNAGAPDPEFGLKLIADGPVDAKIDAALCNAYALGGGQNASLVIKCYREY